MTRWPTMLVAHVWIMPRPPVRTVMPTIVPPSTQRSCMSGWPPSGNSASSKTERTRTGLTTPSPAVTRISAAMPMAWSEYGLKEPAALRATLRFGVDINHLRGESSLARGVVGGSRIFLCYAVMHMCYDQAS